MFYCKSIKIIIRQTSVAILLSSCSGSVIQRIDEAPTLPPPPKQKGYLALPPGPKETRIYLDHRYIGRYQDYPREMILLPVGAHLLRLSAKGFATVYAKVMIRRNQPARLTNPLINATTGLSLSESSVPPK